MRPINVEIILLKQSLNKMFNVWAFSTLMKIEYFSIRKTLKLEHNLCEHFPSPFPTLNFKVETNECVPLLQEQSKQDLLPSHECHMCTMNFKHMAWLWRSQTSWRVVAKTKNSFIVLFKVSRGKEPKSVAEQRKKPTSFALSHDDDQLAIIATIESFRIDKVLSETFLRIDEFCLPNKPQFIN
ncbi:CLUMA_CG019190, isoform A [Clunio marinus]|uniref:CLUMA_CG019190, isoform A n=1 Tax=Clunio marinus TaxID=568069 RepID=A0A1J1J1H0_9DIPT|nr:CLUMA_CG019190, isoform A [Clunio marinus]